MIIVDGHLDLALNALQNNRDLMLDTYTMRALESSTVGKGKGKGTVALPEMRRGRIALCFTTLCARSTGHAAPHIDFGSPMQAYGVAQGQLAYLPGAGTRRTRARNHGFPAARQPHRPVETLGFRSGRRFDIDPAAWIGRDDGERRPGVGS